MVSPYKKKKLERKGHPLVETNASKHTSHDQRPKISSKPLSDKKVYLDIKNNVSLKRIEAKLTALGATLEVFLVKDVDYLVTDREAQLAGRRSQTIPNVLIPSPSPHPSFCSVSPATTDSPTDGVGAKRTRSRAEAMLERVKHQPQNSTRDIFDSAIAWKIPIYPFSRFYAWLEKISQKAAQKSCEGRNCAAVGRGVRELRAPFLKLETGARPEFKQFLTWPTLGLTESDQQNNNGNLSNECQRMTRKVGRTVKEVSSAPGGGNGYCEMCRVHYDQLEVHLVSVQHLKLATDPGHYSQLDSIIQQHNLGVSSVRKSLRIAKSPPPTYPKMGGRQSSSVTSESLISPMSRNLKLRESTPVQSRLSNGTVHMTRSSSATKVASRFSSPSPSLSPTVVLHQMNVNGFERRSVRVSEKSGTDEREVTPSPANDHNLRSRKCANSVSSNSGSSPSPVEGAHSPEKRIDKVHVPRSTEKRKDRHHRSQDKSQLKSNGRSPDVAKGSNMDLRSSRSPSKTPVKQQGTPRPKRVRPKKRLTVEEKLIEDNKSYYKVEVLNSKLRSTEIYITQKQAEERVNGLTSPPSEIKPVVVRFKKVRKSELAVLSDEAENFMFGDAKGKEESDNERDSEDIEDEEEVKSIIEEFEVGTPSFAVIKTENDVKKEGSKDRHESELLKTDFKKETEVCDENEDGDDEEVESYDIEYSFETNRNREPWMEAQQRQIDCTQYYIPLYHKYPKFLLPSEVIRNDRSRGGFRRKDWGKAAIGPANKLAHLDDRPRKSPRCHASTLAIMSSLMRRRPTRECTEKPVSYEEESSLPETVESSGSTAVSLGHIASTTDILGGFEPPCGGDAVATAFANANGKIPESFEAETCLAVDPACINEAVDIVCPSGLTLPLEDLLSSSTFCSLDVDEPPHLRHFEHHLFNRTDSCGSSDCSDLFGFFDDGKSSGKRRKRKRNMTGWPKIDKTKKKAYPFGSSPHTTQTELTPKRRGRPPKYRPPPTAEPVAPPTMENTENSSGSASRLMSDDDRWAHYRRPPARRSYSKK